MTTSLKNKVVLVTGASQGIGLACARELATGGATVVGAARSVTDDLSAVAPDSIAVDLATADGPGRLVEHVTEHTGGIDVLVNNVGAFTARTQGFAAISDEDWQRTFEVNFFSAVRTIRAALPAITERQGVIINVSSINARAPQPPVTDYAAAKAALLNLTVTLAQELGPQGVQVASVSPGPTRTPAWTSPDGFGAALAEASDMSQEEFLADIPNQAGLTTGRLTNTGEIAAVVGLLASGRVPNAHGTDWIVDGGAIKQL